MDIGEFIGGSALTGRQALIIIVLFLAIIVAVGFGLIIFSDFFLDLVT